ncbi:LITAF-like zinc ribbon domain-containing protein [Glomus cerebriforme]|uniref:LITAF-like zinc ribbon domain-containing protein n=1 Tax=Glomus cerebriforme TaxID=658196 RepID=A0A397TGQ8_9GLOM|nr:LITAF-like zinc ribbon domain-containing protein [Glomus cerebriforme]
MANNNDTKSNIVGDSPNPPTQPPPPYSGGSNENTSVTEQSQLLPNRTVTYTTPYSPTPNLTYNPPTNNNDNRSYQQHPQTVILSPVVNLSALRTLPAMTVCPHCHRTVLSVIRYESGGCTWLCCLALSFFSPLCFIPFCVTDLKDVIHNCPNCHKIMAKYCRFDGNVYQHRG